jgi:hydroxyacylglutathione hydrolase
MTLDIQLLPLLTDNYAYLLRDSATGTVGVVDPSEAAPVLARLEELGWTLNYILNTHHHPDHSGGNLGLKAATGAKVVGPFNDQARIPGIDIALKDGDTFALGQSIGMAIDIPGHTAGHMALWFAADKAVFSGDTLFALGCGRMFEGNAAMMWASLSRLRQLPPDTRVFCGHEYTQANARFALSVDPDNAILQARAAAIDRLRAEGKPTIPSTLAEEALTNPFLRADDADLALRLGLTGTAPAQVFGHLRAAKDNFR